MNRALWISRKNYLCSLIKKLSDGHGGDDVDWLRQHCREVLCAHPEEMIEEAIACYAEMLDYLYCYPERKRKGNDLNT